MCLCKLRARQRRCGPVGSSPCSQATSCLDKASKRGAISRLHVLVVRVHNIVTDWNEHTQLLSLRFNAAEFALREVKVHLVTIEIGIVRRTVSVMHTQGLCRLTRMRENLSHLLVVRTLHDAHNMRHDRGLVK